MAVPFFIQEDSEDCSRSLDFLLEQLLITLRQVMMLRRREAATSSPMHTIRHRHVATEVRTVADNSTESLQTPSRPEEATRVSAEEDIASQEHQQYGHHQQQQRQHQQRTERSGMLLPDVVLETTSRPPARDRKIEPREQTTREGRTEGRGRGQQGGWVQVGADLKRIADQLLATQRLDQAFR